MSMVGGRSQRLREVKSLAQSQTAGEWRLRITSPSRRLMAPTRQLAHERPPLDRRKLKREGVDSLSLAKRRPLRMRRAGGAALSSPGR